MNVVLLAIQKLTPPTQRQLGRVCGQRPQAVTRWIRTGRIPAHHVIAVEQETGISRHVLRPDVFGDAPTSLQEAG